MIKNLLAVLFFGLLIMACNSDNSTEPKNDTEFQAGLQDFKDYKSWKKVATKFGPDPLLQSAHGANDSLFRNIYFKDDAKATTGEYETGTIILKELTDETGNVVGITVMAKRGGDFNPSGNGWEWFMTDAQLSQIVTSGDNAQAANGACAGCHSQANSNNNGVDWVFTRN